MEPLVREFKVSWMEQVPPVPRMVFVRPVVVLQTVWDVSYEGGLVLAFFARIIPLRFGSTMTKILLLTMVVQTMESTALTVIGPNMHTLVS